MVVIMIMILMVGGVSKQRVLYSKNSNNMPKIEVKPYDISFFEDYYNINQNQWNENIISFEKGLLGTNAWSISPVLESDLIMYEVTKDPKYLNRLIDNLDLIIKERDCIKGRKNFKGEISPTWSSGNLYHSTFEDLKNKKGEPIIRVITYGKELWSPLWNGNNTTYITVSAGTNLNSFKVRIDNPERIYIGSEECFDETYDNLNFGKNEIILDNEHVKIIKLKKGAKSPEDNPISFERRMIENQLQPYVVHTGLYTKTMADLVYLIKNSDLNDYYQHKADEYLKVITEAVAYHDKEWVNMPNNRGYYKIAEDDLQWPNNVILPWNQMFGLLETMVSLYKITGDEAYKNKIERAANHFMDHVTLNKEKDLYIWNYWEWEGYTGRESHTYAKLDAEFIARCYDAGIVFTELDMRRFANTWATNFIKTGGKLANRVDGTGERGYEYYVAYANDFSLCEPIIFEKSVIWLDEWKEKIEPNDVGYLKSIAKTVKYKKILDPDYHDQTFKKSTERYRR